MDINIPSNVAVSDISDRKEVSQPSHAIGTTASSSGADKIQTLRTVDPMEKTGKKEVQDTQLNATDTKELVEALNEYMDDLQTNLGFSIREDLDRQVVVEIKNRETDELVKQIPSEELLTIMEKMKELSGFLFDQSA
ncbi:MAG: flagellar protein FlaG [Desulfobacula sp.]|nr:flagellar protein FlaG [Desulfobacula sp.]